MRTNRTAVGRGPCARHRLTILGARVSAGRRLSACQPAAPGTPCRARRVAPGSRTAVVPVGVLEAAWYLPHIGEDDLALGLLAEGHPLLRGLLSAHFGSLSGRVYRGLVCPDGTDHPLTGLPVHHGSDGAEAGVCLDLGQHVPPEEAEVLIDLRWVHADRP